MEPSLQNQQQTIQYRTLKILAKQQDKTRKKEKCYNWKGETVII